MTELLDLYDETGTRILGTVLRGNPVPAGTNLMLTAVMTLRSDGRFLMTRRAYPKKYAGRWEITGGCLQSGERAVEGAVRELFEETGIRASEEEFEFLSSRISGETVFIDLRIKFRDDTSYVQIKELCREISIKMKKQIPQSRVSIVINGE